MLELNTIYNEDCLTGMGNIDDASIDCIICDLPYGTTANEWDSVIPLDELWRQYERVLTDIGTVILFGSEPFSSYLRMSNISIYKYDWIWRKSRPTGFTHAKNKPLKDYEIISVFSKGTTNHAGMSARRMIYNPQGVEHCNILKHNQEGKFGGLVGEYKKKKDTYIQTMTNYPRMILEDFRKDSDSWHPTQKPVNLIRYLIRTYTQEGGVILDNCMGSGTTAIACIRENRNFIGFELNKEYYIKSIKRIIEEQRQLKLF